MFNDPKIYATEKGMQTDFSETNSYDQGGGERPQSQQTSIDLWDKSGSEEWVIKAWEVGGTLAGALVESEREDTKLDPSWTGWIAKWKSCPSLTVTALEKVYHQTFPTKGYATTETLNAANWKGTEENADCSESSILVYIVQRTALSKSNNVLVKINNLFA